MFDFILSKTQHESFIAAWKKSHADKHTFDSADYLTHAIFASAVPDIKAKATKAFSPCKHKTPPFNAYDAALRGLIYWTKQKSNTWTYGLELTPEQWTRFLLILDSLHHDLTKLGGA